MKQQNNQIEWKEVEFGNSEYFEVKKGESITKDKVTEGKIPVVAGGQQPAYYHNKSNRPGETITISGSGAYAGFVNYFKEPIFASDCSTVQIKNNLISSRYAYLFLKSYQSKIYSMQKGIAQPHVYPKDIIKIKIPLPFSNGKPDLKEQERIVGFLERSAKQKERSNNAEKLLTEYLKAIFNEMFYNRGFPIDVLNNIVSKEKHSLKRGPFGGSLKKDIFVKEGFKVYEQQNAIYKNMKRGEYYITPKKYGEMIDFSVKEGDFIVSCSGTMGKIAIIPKGSPAGIINQALLKITLDNKKITNLYFQFLFESDEIQNYLFNASHGSGISNFPPMSYIRNLNVPIPPLPLQQKFALIVEHVEKMKENVKKTKQCSEELFNSLTQRAFRGEL